MSSTEVKNKNSGLAIAGFVIAIIGLLLSALPIVNNFAFILGVLGLIFAIVSLVKVRKNDAKKGMAIAAAILSVLTIGVVLITQQIYSKAVNEASKSLQETSQKLDDQLKKSSTGEATEELLKNDVEVTLGQFQATTDEYGLATTNLPVTVKNKNSQEKTYSIQIEAVDASGNRIADDTIYVNNLGSGQSQELKAFQFVQSDVLESVKTASFKIKTVTQS